MDDLTEVSLDELTEKGILSHLTRIEEGIIHYNVCGATESIVIFNCFQGRITLVRRSRLTVLVHNTSAYSGLGRHLSGKRSVVLVDEQVTKTRLTQPTLSSIGGKDSKDSPRVHSQAVSLKLLLDYLNLIGELCVTALFKAGQESVVHCVSISLKIPNEFTLIVDHELDSLSVNVITGTHLLSHVGA